MICVCVCVFVAGWAGGTAVVGHRLSEQAALVSCHDSGEEELQAVDN